MGLPQVALANDDGDVVVENCLLAETALSRCRGLLGRSGLSSGEGMLLRPASSVHTAFMRFAIDVIFVDGDGRVVRVANGVVPWRIVIASGAYAAIELAAGSVASQSVALDDCLYVQAGDGATAASSFRGSLGFRRLAAPAAGR